MDDELRRELRKKLEAIEKRLDPLDASQVC
jgi:hypothetical protein